MEECRPAVVLQARQDQDVQDGELGRGLDAGWMISSAAADETARRFFLLKPRCLHRESLAPDDSRCASFACTGLIPASTQLPFIAEPCYAGFSRRTRGRYRGGGKSKD